MGDGGKGSSPRPFSVSQEEFANSFELIFGKKDKMQVRVKENTDEIGKCGCGRSPTGYCIGWHGLTEDQFAERKELYETGKVDLAGREVK
jgi:CDGSH-type Zn-finger protein